MQSKWVISSNRIVLLLSAYLLVILNMGFWHYLFQHVSLNNNNVIFWLTVPILMLAAMNFCMQLLFWPYLHRLMVPLLLLLSSAVSYAVMMQNVYFDANMLQNILQTNLGEAGAWLTPQFWMWLGITGLLPAQWYCWGVSICYARPWYRELGRRVVAIAASLAIVVTIILLAYGSYISFFRNNKAVNHLIVPTNIIGAALKTAYNAYDAHRPLQRIGLDASHQRRGQKRLLVLVVGETTRAQSWGLNGYQRQTTPELAAMGENIINFPQVTSCGTATAVSLPCLFSNMPRQHYKANLAKHQEGLLDILQRAGVDVLWRDNDGGCKGVCERIRHVDMRDWAPDLKCTGDGCLDESLLINLRTVMARLPDDAVLVLHTMGSHGPAYYQRYPDAFRHFMPTCDTNQIQQCTTEQLRNTYDNTVLYADHILAEIIRLLQSQTGLASAMWYFSDHGESLGENGMYLHATPYAIAPAEQTHIPMLLWVNHDFARTSKLDIHCLRQHARRQAFSHDNIFHSVLGLMDVKTSEYQTQLDLFAPCRQK
ncbi:phosphoethanolamine transferase [Snodgrassella sp. ESL0253]|uniref:phosphoethanolamine transferase n=1 Tax=Snodgrassella sp. ESL0253 TaxID=2705031 RepID=UPI001581BE14|nr:phosphoethanolamine--lipid A transferase [Snodgrassella sp. ESL0253]NUE67506.1 phosphoethanolamine--lipid A transferase [Snodgrassella sp. ESL0253]